MLQHILKRLLNVVLFRYVDDFFGIERSDLIVYLAVCLHAGWPRRSMHSVVQSGLFVVCWGRPSFVEDGKFAHGMSLSVLGCTLETDMDGFPGTPTLDKASPHLLR